MALHDEGITMNDVDPDYVVIGEGNNYNYENILKAVRLVMKGAKLIGTNSDLTGPSEEGIIPACRDPGGTFRGCGNDRRQNGYGYGGGH